MQTLGLRSVMRAVTMCCLPRWPESVQVSFVAASTTARCVAQYAEIPLDREGGADLLPEAVGGAASPPATLGEPSEQPGFGRAVPGPHRHRKLLPGTSLPLVYEPPVMQA